MAAKARQGQVCEWKGYTFKSKFERDVAQSLEAQGLTWEYEPDQLMWTPKKPKPYTPDFKIIRDDGSFYYLETKGFFTSSDRTKMKRVHELHPDVDIRYVFMKASNKVNAKAKQRPTQYSEWCERRGFKWAEKTLPEEWVQECHQTQSTEKPCNSTALKAD